MKDKTNYLDIVIFAVAVLALIIMTTDTLSEGMGFPTIAAAIFGLIGFYTIIMGIVVVARK